MSTTSDNSPSKSRISEVSEIVSRLLGIADAELKEVPSSQPENLREVEGADDRGNTITVIWDAKGLAHPIEVRDQNEFLLAQSWNWEDWSIDRYIECGVDWSRS